MKLQLKQHSLLPEFVLKNVEIKLGCLSGKQVKMRVVLIIASAALRSSRSGLWRIEI